MRRSLLLLVLLGGCVIDAPTFYAPDGGGGDDVDVDAQTTVTLTITRSGDSAGTVTAPEGIACGDDCALTVPNGTTVTLTATPDANTVFTGWASGGCTGIEPCELTLTADTTVDAAFDLSRVTITVAPGGNGTGTVTSLPTGIACGAACVAGFGFGSSVTLTAAPTSGSTFVGWTGGTCSGTDPCTFDATADVEIQASFALDNSVIVTLDGNGDGRVTSDPVGIDCGDDCDEAYGPGTTVTLTAAVIGDSTFDGWDGGGCSGTSTCTVSSDAAVLVTATFILNQHTLGVATNGTGSGTVISDPGGIACPGDCSEAYDSGTTVTLTATPIEGKFAGWSGDCNGTGACAPVLGADRNVTATFTLITVGNVSSPTTNGIYSDPTTIPIEITFSETVVVAGTPTLALNTGGVATYGGGSFTNKLTFNYVVAAGHASTDLDYAASNALSLNGGAIEDALGNDATLALPAPGAPNSLGATKAIVIDAVLPVVSAISGPTMYDDSTSASVTYTVTEVHPGTTSCTFTVGSGSLGTCTTTGASFTTLSQGAHTLRVVHTDTAGNVSAAQTYQWVVDTVDPVVSVISGPSSPSTSTTAMLTYTVTDANAGTTACTMTAGTGTPTGCSNTAVTYTTLSPCAHTVSVTHTDLAGNAAIAKSYSWSVSSKTVFETPSTGTTFTVPSGCTAMEIYAWGAGGGFGNPSGGAVGVPGGGGYAGGTLTVTGAQSFQIAVGGGGGAGLPNASGGTGGAGGTNGGGAGGQGGTYGGGGAGGWSGVYSAATYSVIAAGGGGGGGEAMGGAGGGTTGSAGSNTVGFISGFGGTQSAGGSGGGSNGDSTDGTAGSSRQGGIGGATAVFTGGGGGGGGYFGGGGGYAGPTFAVPGGGGGGGGSSFTAGSVSSSSNVSGSGSNPGNSGNANYISPHGSGGDASLGGNPGLVVIVVR